MGASRVLTQAKAKQTKREAATAALGKVATSLVLQGAKNMQTGGGPELGAGDQPVMKDGKQVMKPKGSFFTPRDDQGNKVQGLGNRLGYTDFMNTSPF